MSDSFFRTIVISATDVAAFPDAIRRMREGAFEGIILRGVYDRATCARIQDRLEADDHGLIRSFFPARMKAYFLGINLNLASPDLTVYFQNAPIFASRLKQVFAGSIDLQSRVSSLLASLDRGRCYAAVPGPSADIHHMFTTLRAHLPGGFIPPHFDNEQAFRHSYRMVTPLIGTDLFSFVLAFSRADTGGALEIFNLHHGGRPYRMADGPDDASHIHLDDVEKVSFRLEPGEMILFNSGRFLHRVTQVEGSTTRWTACSFMAESRAADRVYCWG